MGCLTGKSNLIRLTADRPSGVPPPVAEPRALSQKGKADNARMFGLAQRGREGGTGKVRVHVADGTLRFRDATEHVETKVLPATIVYTDEALRYQDIGGM